MARRYSAPEAHERWPLLDEAVFSYASENLTKAHRCAEKQLQEAKAATSMLDQVSTFQSVAVSTFPSDVVREMQLQLLDKLRERKLILIGYEPPRRVDDEPIEVPNEVIQSPFLIDWISSEISGSGLTFVAVRVVPANVIPELGRIEPRKRLGRRSRKAEIIGTHSRLCAEGKIDRDDLLETVASLIYEDLKHLGTSGLSSKTIKRHVSSLDRPETKGQKDKRHF